MHLIIDINLYASPQSKFPLAPFHCPPIRGGYLIHVIQHERSLATHTHVSFKSDFYKNHCTFFVFIHWIANTNLYASLQSKSFSSHLFTAPPSGGLIPLYSINRRVWQDCFSHNIHPLVASPIFRHVPVASFASVIFKLFKHMPIGFASDFYKNVYEFLYLLLYQHEFVRFTSEIFPFTGLHHS